MDLADYHSTHCYPQSVRASSGDSAAQSGQYAGGGNQINRANKAISKLHTMTSPTCLVLEEGKITEIETRNLVPGDIVLLDSGDIVPADGRLLESYNLQIDESLLTGKHVL